MGRRLLQTLESSLLDLAYLLHDEPPALHVAAQLRERIGWNGFVFGRAHVLQALRGLLQFGIEVADAEPRQGRLHAVDDTRVLTNERLALRSEEHTSELQSLRHLV